MKRHRQTLEELLDQLSSVETSWCDEHAEAVICTLKKLRGKTAYNRQDIIDLLTSKRYHDDLSPREQFEVGATVIRLFLDLSKDEFTAKFKEKLDYSHLYSLNASPTRGGS